MAFANTFLVGASTAAHQVEGNNIHSDYWTMEHMEYSSFQEPSGIACDHYHRYEADIRMLAEAGLNAYRFSIEWARIEPESGKYDEQEIGHYRAGYCRYVTTETESVLLRRLCKERGCRMKKYSLNQGWQVTEGSLRNPLMMNMLSGWKSCTLPHDYQISAPRDPASLTEDNEGWTQGAAVFYQKEFVLTEEAADKRCWLELEGVAGVCQVWVNGRNLSGCQPDHRSGRAF